MTETFAPSAQTPCGHEGHPFGCTSVTLVEPEAPAVKVGDFFASSWGYDQTNVDFYKVVGLTKSGKSVRVQRWTAKVAKDTGPQVYLVPGDSPATYNDWSAVEPGDDFWERQEKVVERECPVETKRLRFGGYCGASFSVNSYSGAYLWDGTPQMATGQGWGH